MFAFFRKSTPSSAEPSSHEIKPDHPVLKQTTTIDKDLIESLNCTITLLHKKITELEADNQRLQSVVEDLKTTSAVNVRDQVHAQIEQEKQYYSRLAKENEELHKRIKSYQLILEDLESKHQK
jgi:hypothetical protein